MATSKTHTKSKPQSISEKLNILKKMDGILNVHQTKIAEELGILVRQVTEKMLLQSDIFVCVLRLLHVIQIQHTHVIRSQKIQ